MAILTHGSDLRLAPTLRPFVVHYGQNVRHALQQIGRLRFQAVQLDMTLSGLRARDLNQRARKDLLAMLGRANMQLAGLDLFIARKEFLSADRVDRAMTTTLATIALAGDLGRVPLSLPLPVKSMGSDLKDALLHAADGHGINLVIHAEDQVPDLLDWLNQVDMPCLGASVDPASLIVSQVDPIAILHQLAGRLQVGRVSDAQLESCLRCPLGEGELDLQMYRMALDLAAHRRGPIVMDLRGLENPVQAAQAGRAAWDDSVFSA